MKETHFSNMEMNKKIIKFNLTETIRQNNLLYKSRQDLRSRYITVFSILLASLGVILGTTKDIYFNYELSKTIIEYLLMIVFLLFLTISLVLFLLFLEGKILIVEDSYERMNELTNELIKINPYDVLIELTNEKMIVTREYYHYIEQLKSYKISNCSIMRSMKKINRFGFWFTLLIIVDLMIVIILLFLKLRG